MAGKEKLRPIEAVAEIAEAAAIAEFDPSTPIVKGYRVLASCVGGHVRGELIPVGRFSPEQIAHLGTHIRAEFEIPK